jgi:hypothetical protein
MFIVPFLSIFSVNIFLQMLQSFCVKLDSQFVNMGLPSDA